MPASIYRSEQGYQALMNFYDGLLAQWPVAVESRRVKTRCGETHMLITGAEDAPPLVLLHGAGASAAATWIPNIAALSQHFRVYALDTPGDAGRSAGVHLSNAGRIPADWVVDVLDGLGIDKAHLGGLSLGGWMALHTALHEPKRINRLVAMAPATFLPTNAGFLMRALAAAMLPTRSTVHDFVRSFLAPTTPVDSSVVEGMLLIFKHMRVNTSLPSTHSDADLLRIKVPVLFIVGDHEVIYDPRKAIERARHCFPNVRTELIGAAGHAVSAEQPERVNEVVIEFLAAQPSS